MIELIKFQGIIFLAAFVITAVITQPVSVYAKKNGFVDSPGLHKIHKEVTPLFGGLAIFLGILLVMLYFSVFSIRILSLLSGSIIIVITGLVDDLYYLKPLKKLFGQTIAAAIIVLPNPDSITLLANFFENIQMPNFILYISLIVWIVLMINSINLIDGLDGLAAGTAAIIFISLALINYYSWGNAGMMLLQITAAGACLGFLCYNFYPARIFMGDTGSMLLGFLMAATFIFSLRGVNAGELAIGSLFVFAYPLLDITFAIMRRIYRRRSILKADKGHIHHILLSLGFSVRKTVLIIYLLSVFFSILAFIVLRANLETLTIAAIGLITFVATMIAYWRLHLISNRNGLDEDAEDKQVMREF